jgi:hypothetical protein
MDQEFLNQTDFDAAEHALTCDCELCDPDKYYDMRDEREESRFQAYGV